MDEVVIGSPALGVAFRADPPGQRPVEWLTVSVVAPGLSASGRAWDHPPTGGLAAYFDRLAGDWRGWRGERTHQFIEGDCSITATHDGHVRLTVKLGSVPDAEWNVAVTITVDAGEQLSQAASDVARLLRR